MISSVKISAALSNVGEAMRFCFARVQLSCSVRHWFQDGRAGKIQLQERAGGQITSQIISARLL